jgi:hypothetical protein
MLTDVVHQPLHSGPKIGKDIIDKVTKKQSRTSAIQC